VDAGAPWTCAGCGAGNADYRRRCFECGERRSTDGSDQVVVPAAPARPPDVELPWLARRPARRVGPVRLVLAVVVLALAAYGAVTYVAALP
jgi:hypothetical protein